MKESNYLKKTAIKNGLCQDWQNNWDGSNIEALIDMYKRGIDFCIENDYPNIEYMTDKFRGKTEEFGVYINEIFTTNLSHDIYVVNGDSKGNMINNEYGCSKIYIRHNSEINVVCQGNSITFIDMFDNAKLNISMKDNARCIVYRNGCEITGDIDKAKIK